MQRICSSCKEKKGLLGLKCSKCKAVTNLCVDCMPTNKKCKQCVVEEKLKSEEERDIMSRLNCYSNTFAFNTTGENSFRKSQQDRSNQEIHDLKKLAVNTVNQELDKSKKLIIDLEKDKTDLKTELKRATQHKYRLQIDLDSANEKLKEYSQLNTKLYGDIDELIKKNQTQRDSFNNLLKKETSQKNELEKENETLRAQVESTKQRILQIEQQSNVKTEALSQFKKLIENSELEKTSLQSELEQSKQNNYWLRQSLTSTNEKLTLTEEKITLTKDELAASQNLINSLQQKLEECEILKTTLEKENGSLRIQLEESSQKSHNLQKELTDEKKKLEICNRVLKKTLCLE